MVSQIQYETEQYRLSTGDSSSKLKYPIRHTKALLTFIAGRKPGGSDKALTLPPRPKVGVPGLAIGDESNPPSNIKLPAKPKVQGLGLAVADGSVVASAAIRFVMSSSIQ